ncbi:hypothetical protein [Peribacillus sp. SCS-37]
MRTKDNFLEGAENTKDNQIYAPEDKGQKQESPQTKRPDTGQQ